MPWIRGLIFSFLVPGVIGFVIPFSIDSGGRPIGGVWNVGWLPIIVGALVYVLCLLRFLAAGGTPAIFFTRPLRFLIGEEPAGLVSQGLYRYSRNPMYVGVLAVIFGQAVVFASPVLAAYGLAVFVFFHLAVVFGEEPHLRRTRGHSYDEYCKAVPRWLGLPRP